MTTAAERVKFRCPLSVTSQQKAKRELNEDETTRKEQLVKLQQLIDTRPDIKFRTDEDFLIRFLRAKKFDADRAFKVLVHYYEVRRQYKDVFTDALPSTVLPVLEANIHFITHGRDNEGRRVLIFKMENWDVEKFGASELTRTATMLLEMLLAEDETQINGIVVIGDAGGLNMGHITKMGPSASRKMLDILQNALPLRFKAMHFVNEPKLFDTAFAIFRPFLSEKLKKRLQFHGDEFGALHNQVPSTLLPVEFGGAVQEYDNKEWREIIKSMTEEFIENNKYGFPKTADTLGGKDQGADAAGGLTGSFKKLDM
ncbi:alpha-tocopherol transfer protein-like isoform X1 [Saccoglossus kowalevskii]|uniref:Alpha-tocopherol transfer protein-like n=1 Tax=Saccoglossus kowalevskii TaxID=10224 RepID=A0ABM0MLZ7_SACKO|nr:PREDICTED: alpha-tocopherol transfer protein-like [Saccoglossus kowalevskii]